VKLAIVIDGSALDQLHHHVRDPVLGRSSIEKACDMGMIERRKNLALCAEALENGGSIETSAHELDRHLLFILAIRAFGAVYLTHSAVPDLLDHPVDPDSVAGARVLPRTRCFELECRVFQEYAASVVVRT